MSYFDKHQLERESWQCSLTLLKYFEKQACVTHGIFKNKSEYVVVWYNHRLLRDGSQTFVEVKFVELTNPIYIKKDSKTGKDIEYQSFLTVRLPINYLHKVLFGTIWLNGESSQRFILSEYTISINENRDNISWLSMSYAGFAKKAQPFNFQDYIHHSEIDFFQKDNNQLLNITYNDYVFTIHPLQFYLTHYGYSTEVKRILTTYNWKKVEEKLLITKTINVDSEKYIILPRNLSHKDAVFLYHLKYDKYTQAIIKEFNANVLLSKEKGRTYRIPCWHKQKITLSLKGIVLGKNIFCCQITGISQPEGEDINLILAPKSKSISGELSDNSSNDLQFRTIIQPREHNLENLDLALNPINNLVTVDVMEKLKLIGEKRKINKIQDTNNYVQNSNINLIPYKDPINFGVGDKYGALGNTGIANCFYDFPDNENINDKSRLETVWEHATRLRLEMKAKVCWYTPKCGFNENDDFTLISLKDVCCQLGKDYPYSALVICINVQKRILFVISFPEKSNGSGFSSIVYEPNNIQEFLSSNINKDTLFKLLIEMALLGAVESDYIDARNGRMAKFKHKQGINNNWVKNGIQKLL